ncbi:MAG: hypothetical protein Q9195_007046 [Heterodermia aff. obscurata]
MDLAKTLIRSVARAFYETRQVLVIDALLVHSALTNEDLALLMGMQQKDLRKSLGRLKEDKMMATHSRQETREGQQRPVNKDYYYIDFHTTIDAIKYRVFNLTKKVQNMYQPSEERKDYHCPRCKANWTQIEVLDKFGPEGFECHRCGGVLERDERAAGEATGHEKHSKLMSQLSTLLKLLQQIDEEDIPRNDFESAFAVAVPIQRDEQVNPSRATVPVNAVKAKPATVKGVTQAAAPLGIDLTTASERTAAEQQAEAKRRAAIAAQNKLPEWISNSTVNGDMSAVGIQDEQRRLSNTQTSGVKTEEEEKAVAAELNDEVAAYYAQMEKEDAMAPESDDDEDEDEDEFEDVAVDGATPSSFTSARVNGAPKEGLLNGILKHRDSESGSSALGTGMSTPAGSQPLSVDDVGPPPVKKVRLEGEENGGEEANGAAAPAKDSDEDDDAEFEDAL